MIHFYGQSSQHEPVIIVGDESSIEILIKGLQEALSTHNSKTDVLFTSDGEGYNVYCAVRSDLEQFPVPYTSEDCQETDASKWKNLLTVYIK